MKESIKNIFEKLRKTGFFSIYLATICSKVITLFGGILIVRILSTDDYAAYTLVINAISILCIFGDLGASSAIIQYGVESENDSEKQKEFLVLGIKLAMFSSILSALLILFSQYFYPYKSETIEQLAILMFAIPILTNLINYISAILRVKRKNHKYSLYQLINTLIHYIVIIIFTIIWGLEGSLFAQYCYNIIIVVIGYIFIRKLINTKNTKSTKNIKKKEKRGFIKLAVGSQINNTIASLLYTIDIFILGIMITNTTDISLYKVATIIPNALVFLPQCLAIYFTPYFVSHNRDKKWVKENTKKLMKISIPIYFAITAILIFLSKIIFSLLYGEEYISATMPYTFLMIGFFFIAAIKNPLSNIIYTLHKVKFNIISSVFSLILNVVLNIIFIYMFGMLGIAISTMFVNILMAIITSIYCKKYINQIDEKSN